MPACEPFHLLPNPTTAPIEHVLSVPFSLAFDNETDFQGTASESQPNAFWVNATMFAQGERCELIAVSDREKGEKRRKV